MAVFQSHGKISGRSSNLLCINVRLLACLLVLIVAASMANHDLQRDSPAYLCVSDIINGESEIASKHFHQSMCGTNLTEIVMTAFNLHGKPDQVANIVRFIQLLESCEQSTLAKRVLLMEMKINKLTETPDILILGRPSNNCKNPLSLELELRKYVIELIYSWGKDVRDERFKDILNFASNQPSVFQYYLNATVKQAYVSNSEPVQNFLIRLQNIEQAVRGLTALYELMEDNILQPLSTTDVLTFEHKLAGLPQVHDVELAKLLEDLRAKLASHSAPLIQLWAEQVSENQTYNVFAYMKQDPDSFRYHLRQLIENIYVGSLDKAVFTMKFIQMLPSAPDQIVGFKSLQNVMRKNFHLDTYQLVTIAYAVKNLTDLPDYTNIEDKYKNMFGDLKESFSSGVKNIIWSSRKNCTILNSHSAQYLYIASGWNNYLALVWVPPGMDSDLYWNLKLKNDGERFVMKSVYYGRILDADRDRFDSERDFVGSWDNEDHEDTQWRIIPDGEKLLIYSLKKSAFMYGSTYHLNSDRRYAFLWKSATIPNIVKDLRRWDIHCYD